MIKLQYILKEMIATKLPKENLLNWLLDRMDKTFIFFDTETTGLNRLSELDQVVQLSAIAVKLNGDNFKFFELDRFNEMIKLNEYLVRHLESEPDEPEDELEKERWKRTTKKAILKFNQYDLVNSDKFNDEIFVLEKFDRYLKSHDDVVLFAHNAPFDIRWVQFNNIFKESTLEVYDTLDFFRNIFHPQLNKMVCDNSNVYSPISDKFPKKDGGKVSNKLSDLCVGFDNSINNLLARKENAHNAIIDCELTIDVFQEGLNLIRNKI